MQFSFASVMGDSPAEHTPGRLTAGFEREVVVIDGKTIRRSFDHGRDQSPLHVVSAWASEQGLVLSQRSIDGKSNKITAVPELLGPARIAKQHRHPGRHGVPNRDCQEDPGTRGRMGVDACTLAQPELPGGKTGTRVEARVHPLHVEVWHAGQRIARHERWAGASFNEAQARVVRCPSRVVWGSPSHIATTALVKPDGQAAALAQGCIVGGRIRRPVPLLRDAMMSFGIGFERQEIHPGQ